LKVAPYFSQAQIWLVLRSLAETLAPESSTDLVLADVIAIVWIRI
jgi:hypothetical protein